MNETSSSPPPAPCNQATTGLGEQPTASLVPPAALDQPFQWLGTGPTRVEADFRGHHLRVHGATLRETSARISRSSGIAHPCAADGSQAVA